MYCDVMWCDVMRCDVMWCDVVQDGVVRCCDVMWCDVLWCDGMWWTKVCDVMWCDKLTLRCDVMWVSVGEWVTVCEYDGKRVWWSQSESEWSSNTSGAAQRRCMIASGWVSLSLCKWLWMTVWVYVKVREYACVCDRMWVVMSEYVIKWRCFESRALSSKLE